MLIMKKLIFILFIFSFLCSCASPRPWTKQEKTAAKFFMVGIIADAYTTNKMLDNGHTEMNPILDEHPSDTALVVYFPVTAIIGLGFAHFTPELRKLLLYGYGGSSFSFAVRNQNLD